MGSDGFNSSLVQGAGNERVMHWAFPGAAPQDAPSRAPRTAARPPGVHRSITPYLDTERPTRHIVRAGGDLRAARTRRSPAKRSTKNQHRYRAPARSAVLERASGTGGRSRTSGRALHSRTHRRDLEHRHLDPNFAGSIERRSMRAGTSASSPTTWAAALPQSRRLPHRRVARIPTGLATFHSFRTSTKERTPGRLRGGARLRRLPETLSRRGASMQATGPSIASSGSAARAMRARISHDGVSLAGRSRSTRVASRVTTTSANTGAALTRTRHALYWSQTLQVRRRPAHRQRGARERRDAWATLTMPLAGVVAADDAGTYYCSVAHDAQRGVRARHQHTNNCLPPDTVVRRTSARASPWAGRLQQPATAT